MAERAEVEVARLSVGGKMESAGFTGEAVGGEEAFWEGSGGAMNELCPGKEGIQTKER